MDELTRIVVHENLYTEPSNSSKFAVHWPDIKMSRVQAVPVSYLRKWTTNDRGRYDKKPD